MLDLYHAGKIKLEEIVQKMCHNVAILLEIDKRGNIRPGYHADLVIADQDAPWKVENPNIISKCGWSPFEGHVFKSIVTHTVVSEHLVCENRVFHEEKKGEQLKFSRKI